MPVIRVSRGRSAIVDMADYDELVQFRWSLSTNGYAIRRIKNKNHFLHRLLLGARDGQVVDHRNRNKLDNRRNNLRFVTNAQNQQNSKLRIDNKSGFVGVYLMSGRQRRKRWCARLARKTLGYFHTPEEAALRYDQEARLVYGPDARTNY